MSEWKKSVVRISINRNSVGTGFVVGFERKGGNMAFVEVLTALHVIADFEESKKQEIPIWLSKTAKIRLQENNEVLQFPLIGEKTDQSQVLAFDLTQDWALLRFFGEVKQDIPPARLTPVETRIIEKKWRSFGYSEAASDDGETHFGQFLDYSDGSMELFDEVAASGSGGFIKGLSGAPCEFEGYVIGIIIEAFHDAKRRSVNGKVFALPIECVTKGCKHLSLAPGPQLFEEHVEAALQNIPGTMLQKMAQGLDVPLIECKEALQIRVARTLLLAPIKKLRDALELYSSHVKNVKEVVEMALALGLIDKDSSKTVQSCFKTGAPRHIAVIANQEETANLLVLKALGGHDRKAKRFGFLSCTTGEHEDWLRWIRKMINTFLGNSEDELGEEQLFQQLEDDDFSVLLGFRFGNWSKTTPIEIISRCSKIHALVLVSSAGTETFRPDDCDVIEPFLHPNTEETLVKSYRTLKVFLK